MGRAQISVDEAHSLKVGDVIRSDRRSTEPMRMSIEGCPRYLVRPYAAADGTSGVQIAGEIDGSE